MIALGFDPGPTEIGWAIVLAPSPRLRTVPLERWREPFQQFASARANVPAKGAVVAVETPVALHPRAGASAANLFARSKQLLATARVAGMLSAHAAELSHDLFEASPTVWRRAFCGQGNASDAVIKRACQMQVEGLPRRTSAHVRDALGVGIVAIWNPAVRSSLSPADVRQ